MIKIKNNLIGNNKTPTKKNSNGFQFYLSFLMKP